MFGHVVGTMGWSRVWILLVAGFQANGVGCVWKSINIINHVVVEMASGVVGELGVRHVVGKVMWGSVDR